MYIGPLIGDKSTLTSVGQTYTPPLATNHPSGRNLSPHSKGPSSQGPGGKGCGKNNRFCTHYKGPNHSANTYRKFMVVHQSSLPTKLIMSIMTQKAHLHQRGRPR